MRRKRKREIAKSSIKLQSMKAKQFSLSVIMDCYKVAAARDNVCRKQSQLHGKLIMFRLMLTRLLNLLEISKTAITHGIMSHLPFYEKCIFNIRAQGREEFQQLIVAYSHPTSQQQPPQVSQLQPPNNVQGSGMSLPSSDNAVTVPCLNCSGKRLHIPEGSSIINYEGYPMSAIDSSTKKVGGMVVQEEPGFQPETETRGANFRPSYLPVCSGFSIQHILRPYFL